MHPFLLEQVDKRRLRRRSRLWPTLTDSVNLGNDRFSYIIIDRTFVTGSIHLYFFTSYPTWRKFQWLLLWLVYLIINNFEVAINFCIFYLCLINYLQECMSNTRSPFYHWLARHRWKFFVFEEFSLPAGYSNFQ